MKIVPIDPRPDIHDWAKRYGGPMKIPAKALDDFTFAMEEWFSRHRMSWGRVIDYRTKRKLELITEYARRG